jgi:hypothetical protein
MVTFSTSDSKLTSSANYNHSAKIPSTKPLAMGILSNSATLAKEGAARTAASQTLNNRQLLPLLQCKTTRKYNHSSNNYIYDTSNKDGRIIDETNLMIIENANIPLGTDVFKTSYSSLCLCFVNVKSRHIFKSFSL